MDNVTQQLQDCNSSTATAWGFHEHHDCLVSIPCRQLLPRRGCPYGSKRASQTIFIWKEQDIADFLYKWRNLYRFSQQGWEAMNLLVKTFLVECGGQARSWDLPLLQHGFSCGSYFSVGSTNMTFANSLSQIHCHRISVHKQCRNTMAYTMTSVISFNVYLYPFNRLEINSFVFKI